MHRYDAKRMRFIRSAKLLSALLSLSLSYPLAGADTRGVVCNFDPSSALAFVGTLTDLAPAQTPSPGWWNSATFHVTELLQGQKSAVVIVLMRSDLCRDVGTTPTVGGTYLVQTHSSPKGSIYQLEECEQVRPVDQANAALEYLRSSQKGTAPTELYGDSRVETGGYPWRRVPLPKTKIHLVGPSQQIDFVTNEDGIFHGILNPGKYAITAEFPTGYAAYFVPSAIAVTEHRCTQLTVGVHPTGSITGHIVDVDGDPLGPMSVQLTLETAADQQFVQSVYPDEKSNLKADNLLPGQYILGLNTYLPVSRFSPRYPPVYFPGVGSRSEARVITLGAGEHKVLSEMRIKKGQECEFPVLVTDNLGKPSASAAVALAYRDYPHFYSQAREQTDENGRETVYAVFPGPVFFRAEKQLEDGSTAQSENLELDSCPAKPVSLKLSRVAVDQPEPKKK